MAFFLHVSSVNAQNLSEEELKSAYLFNFAKYIEWQDDKDDTFTIGVYGLNAPNDHVLSKMAELKNRSGSSRRYQIVHFYIGEKITDIEILYIPDIKRSQQIDLFQRLKNRNILTVGDNISHFCSDGGIINFLPMDNPRPFRINNKRAKAAQLRISPKLLILAELCSTKE